MKSMKRSRFKAYLRPFLSWRFLVSFGAAWFLTNGIFYVMAFAPLAFIPGFLVWFSRAYIAFIYMPWSPEKLITIPLAMWIHVKIFSHKDKQHLDDMLSQAKEDWAAIKSKYKAKMGRKKR